MFNGVIHSYAAGTGTFDLDGTPIPGWRSAGWSVWDYQDGGPMAPKCAFYRVIAVPEQEYRALPKAKRQLAKAA